MTMNAGPAGKAPAFPAIIRQAPTLIIGGGPAGSAAAIRLARAGRRPLLLERTREPNDPVCGGFVSADAIDLLARTGVEIDHLGASRIDRIRLVVGHRLIEARLPFVAAGLSRRLLDAVLIERAEHAGAAVERGIAVRRLDRVARRAVLADRGEIRAEAIFLATGKHDLRGIARDQQVIGGDLPLGFRAPLACSRALRAALDGVIELHLFEGGYAGLLLQEGDSANFCFSVCHSRLKAAGGDPERVIDQLATEAPLLAERYGAGARLGGWSSVARIPYGWRARSSTPGIFRLGDQAAVIASLAGDGIAIALASAFSASEALTRSGPAGAIDYQRAFSRHAARPLAVAGALRRVGENAQLAAALFGMLRLQPRVLALAASMTRIMASRESIPGSARRSTGIFPGGVA